MDFFSDAFDKLMISYGKKIYHNCTNNSKSARKMIKGIGFYLILVSSIIFFIAFLLMPKSTKSSPNYNLFMISNVFIAIGVYIIIIGIIIIVKSSRKIKNKQINLLDELTYLTN
jgi:hypothetical protein